MRTELNNDSMSNQDYFLKLFETRAAQIRKPATLFKKKSESMHISTMKIIICIPQCIIPFEVLKVNRICLC